VEILDDPKVESRQWRIELAFKLAD